MPDPVYVKRTGGKFEAIGTLMILGAMIGGATVLPFVLALGIGVIGFFVFLVGRFQ